MSGHSASRLDPHRLSEFIYGTVTAMVAVAGISPMDGLRWHGALAAVVGGAMTIWFAHAYSALMGHRVSSGVRLGPRALAEALRSTWPVVTAGGLVASPLLGSGVGLVDLPTALAGCMIVGIAVLASVGWAAGRGPDVAWWRKLVLIALSSGLGVLVIVGKRWVHH